MSAHSDLDEFMRRWRASQERGESVTLEILCADRPDLLDALRAKVATSETNVTSPGAESHSSPGCNPLTAPVGSELCVADDSAPWSSERRQRLVEVPGFEILGELGRGGMGIVYKARQLALKRVVALKMILAGSHAGPSHLLRFQREAEAAAQLRHENIVQVYEIGAHEGCPYFALEYVEGGSLRELVRDHPLAPRRAAALIEQMARAIHEAHTRGIVHRDLKPSNVLMTLAGVPKISDFGLAKQLDDDSFRTQTGAIIGTPSYMAPEQADGKSENMGPLVDVYALGATLYDLLTGKPPFNGASVMDTLAQVRAAEPVAPARLQPGVPRDLETICLKCLAKEPRRRYPSASALADDLKRFLEGRPITARSVGRVERVWRWSRRNPWAATLLLSLLLGLCATLGLTVWALGERARADRLAIDEANQRYLAEEELYRSLLSRVRERSVTSQPGWTWQSLLDLEKARELKDVPRDRVEERSLMAECLGRFDLREIGILAKGIDPTCLAFTQDGRFLAVGERRHAVACSVQVWDVASQTQKAQYTLNTAGSSFLNAVGGRPGYYEGFTSLAYSPDGRWLVAGTRRGRLCRWDTTVDKPDPVIWTAHTDAVHALAFAVDGKHLVSGSDDKTMLWSPLENWAGKPLDTKASTFRAAFSRDGELLVLAGGRVRLYRGAARDLWKLEPEDFSSDSVALSPDGRTLASVRERDIILIDAERARESRILRAPHSNEEQAAACVGLSFSADGAILAAELNDNRVQLWDVASGRVVTSLFIADRAQPIAAFSPDGKHLVVAGQRQTLVYELRAPDVQATLAHHAHPVRHMTFANEGKSLICQGDRRIAGNSLDEQVTHWDTTTGVRRAAQCCLANPNPRVRFRVGRGGLDTHPADSVCAVASALNGGFLVPLRDRPVSGPAFTLPVRSGLIEIPQSDFQGVSAPIVEVRQDPMASRGSAVRLAPHKETGVRVRIPERWRKSPSDAWAVFATCRVDGLRRPGLKLQYTCRHSDGPTAPGFGWDVIHFPDDHYHHVLLDVFPKQELAKQKWTEMGLRLEGSTESSYVWLDRVFMVPLKVNSWPTRLDAGYVGPIGFAPDGRLWGIVSENHVVAWHLPQLTIQSQWNNLIGATMLGSQRLQALAAGSRWVLAGAEDGYVFALLAKSGEQEHGWMGPEGGVRSLALDPTESVAVVGTEKGRLRLTRVADGETLRDFPGHGQSVESVGFSSDGKLLVSGSLDQTIRIWQQDSDGAWEHVLTLKAPPGRLAETRLSPNADLLAVVNSSNYAIRLWRLDRLRTRLAAVGLDWGK